MFVWKSLLWTSWRSVLKSSMVNISATPNLSRSEISLAAAIATFYYFSVCWTFNRFYPRQQHRLEDILLTPRDLILNSRSWGKEGETKLQHLARSEPMTSKIWGVFCTTKLQPLTLSSFALTNGLSNHFNRDAGIIYLAFKSDTGMAAQTKSWILVT